jgi:hypothetical protein
MRLDELFIVDLGVIAEPNRENQIGTVCTVFRESVSCCSPKLLGRGANPLKVGPKIALRSRKALLGNADHAHRCHAESLQPGYDSLQY